MSSQKDTIYIKIEKNIAIKDRQVKLSDVAKLAGTNEAMIRQIKQMRIYSFPQNAKKEECIQVISTLKIMDMILKEYPNADISNEGEADFVLEYQPKPAPSRKVETAKCAILSVLVFFGAAFSIMAFNNDVGVADVFSKLYRQVTGETSGGVTELEICYSIGLPIGVLMFFNHFGRHKITNDPTPVQVEMRKYEKDVDDTYIQNSGRGGKTLDVD